MMTLGHIMMNEFDKKIKIEEINIKFSIIMFIIALFFMLFFTYIHNIIFAVCQALMCLYYIRIIDEKINKIKTLCLLAKRQALFTK